MKKLEPRNSPGIFVTPQEREQDILQKQTELDQLDFEIAKKERERKLRKVDGIGVKIKDALEDLGTALDGFGDMGLSESKINGNPEKIRSIDKLASFD